MEQIVEKAIQARDFIFSRTALRPKVGLVLGTGLSGLAEKIEKDVSIDYGEIPHFPVSTVEGHRGRLIVGRLSDVPVVAMAGRFHYYEGYSMQQVTLPVRVFQEMGVERLILSNAAGGVNEDYDNGQIVLVRDHINYLPSNPLRGTNDDRLGVRFPDMLHAYDRQWLSDTLALSQSLGMNLTTGVYLALPGPNLETAAEYVMAHRLGADLVGMSTVPEVIAAHHAGIKVLVLSVVSNVCYPPERIQVTTLEDILSMVNSVAPKMEKLVTLIVGDLK